MDPNELVSDHISTCVFLLIAIWSAIGLLVNVVAHKRSSFDERLADVTVILVFTLLGLVDILDLLRSVSGRVITFGVYGILFTAISALGFAFSRRERFRNWFCGFVGLFAIFLAIVKAALAL